MDLIYDNHKPSIATTFGNTKQLAAMHASSRTLRFGFARHKLRNTLNADGNARTTFKLLKFSAFNNDVNMSKQYLLTYTYI